MLRAVQIDSIFVFFFVRDIVATLIRFLLLEIVATASQSALRKLIRGKYRVRMRHTPAITWWGRVEWTCNHETIVFHSNSNAELRSLKQVNNDLRGESERQNRRENHEENEVNEHQAWPSRSHLHHRLTVTTQRVSRFPCAHAIHTDSTNHELSTYHSHCQFRLQISSVQINCDSREEMKWTRLHGLVITIDANEERKQWLETSRFHLIVQFSRPYASICSTCTSTFSDPFERRYFCCTNTPYLSHLFEVNLVHWPSEPLNAH